MKTTYHSYYYDVSNPAEAAEYAALKARMKAAGIKCFETWGGNSHYNPKLDGMELTLETDSLFNNQWNTAPVPGVSETGLRVFDWAQGYPAGRLTNKNAKRGHWLEMTDEMREVRRNTHKCGYCGKQEPAAKGHVFCPHCIGSEYLTEKDLHLTRMQAVDDESPRAPLTDAERAHLLPLFKTAQINGNTERDKKRIAAKRADMLAKRDAAIKKAVVEFDGFTWLMDRGINTDNVIYYNHVDKFSFGWRHPVDDCLLSDLLNVISEFPFSYEIKCADGRTLSN